MKITIVALGLLVLSGTVLAAQATQDDPKDPSMGTQRRSRNPTALDEQQRTGELSERQVSAEVVSVDAQAKTITVTKTWVKTPESPVQSLPGTAAETKTWKVEGSAVASLSTIHKGDKVMLTCRSTSSGTSTGTPPTGSGSTVASSDADCPAVTPISKSQ